MVMQIGVVLYGLYFVSKNEMTFGELIIFQQLSDLIQLLIHINFLELWKSIVGVKLLFEIWDAEGNNIDGIVEKGDEKSAIIDLENVYFKYSQDENVILKDISFRVHKGESIAIVGTSGSGKSTIAKLICGFNKPLSGKISYKGYEYDDWNLKKLRKGISIVEQNAYLFPVSIYDNIASGKYGYIDENNSDLKKSVEKAAEQAGLTEFIESLEDGYQGIVGENGDTMSGGQNQRITIARAFIKDSELLVLDEPTSALDVEIEQKIQKSIEELMKNRTTIIIAHRLSTIKNVQRILVLHEGEIVEQGTHSELINKKGRYFNLYNMQLTQQKGGQ
jgi:ABC-type multidrug transport system fused ATPase/permease subunit